MQKVDLKSEVVTIQSSDYIIKQLEGIARTFPRRTPRIPVVHPAIGDIGMAEPGRGFKLHGMTSREFAALMRDQDRAFRNPKKYLKQLGAITTWDGVIANRTAGNFDDRLHYKGSTTTVANNWSSFFRVGGSTGTGAYSNAPNGALTTSANAGALTTRNPPANNSYLLNFGAQHMTGTNVVMLVDLLVAVGNILTSAAANTAISHPALTRWTDGVGVFHNFDIVSTLGANAANATITYTNSNNTANQVSPANVILANGVAFRLALTAGGAVGPMNANDLGIRSITNVNISANMAAGGIMGLNLFKPLLLIPTLAVSSWVERSAPAMLGGITLLPKDANNQTSCLVPYVLTSTTSTGIQTYFIQTVEG